MSFPEPSDVGPAVGGNLPVSETDRGKVVTLLESAYAEGRITTAEHAERMQAAADAETFDDLVPLTRDLVALDAPSAPTPSWSQAPGQAGAEPELIVTLFGSTERRGRWQPRRNLSVLNLFGGTVLDLREATFTDNTCEINVFCLFGGIEVLVPEGTDLENRALAVFGGAGAKVTTPPAPGAPKVVLRGFVGFGGVEARVKRLKNKD
ncbi:DUF1707 domain-containing protein [Micropruina sp.]|uniref:DUF1707 SHOCT-like domain-containing protein n=1 Tax=Micropruina sp. TaxID=2737536 RepID=UPI00261B63C5|nr:DUF1707 domain-containing protein [Micropruina sp.]